MLIQQLKASLSPFYPYGSLQMTQNIGFLVEQGKADEKLIS
jgi:hypothetical protein